MSIKELTYSTLILAGGAGRRMEGRDKGLVSYRGKPLVAWVKAAIPNTCDDIMISCNRNFEQYEFFAQRLVFDEEINTPTGQAFRDRGDKGCGSEKDDDIGSALPASTDKRVAGQGPLAGIAAGLRWAKHDFVLVLPCDNPNLSPELLTFLLQQASWQESVINVVTLAGKMEPLHLLLHRSRLANLEQVLARGQRRVQAWLHGESLHAIDANAFASHFANLNHSAELG